MTPNLKMVYVKLSNRIRTVILRMKVGAIKPSTSRFVFLVNKAGTARTTRHTSRINATVPPVTINTFKDSKVDRLDKEDGFVTKNNHSMKA
jgi:hypothetical protein